MHPGKGGGKGKGKGKGSAPASGKGSAPASGKGKTPVFSADRLRATDGTGVHGHVRPATPPDERRFDRDGSGPHTKQQFHQHYGSLDQWNAAAAHAEPRPQGRRLTHPPISRPLHPPQADEASSSESNAKAARTRTEQPFSPGRSLAGAHETLAIHEHGSNYRPRLRDSPPYSCRVPLAIFKRLMHILVLHVALWQAAARSSAGGSSVEAACCAYSAGM